MSPRFEAPKGAFDYLPPESEERAAVEAAMVGAARRAAYRRIETPVFEDTEVFSRGVGASTDVVLKEMYTFEDKGGRSLTLRPEGTAGVVRALIEHGRLGGLTKVWYSGPFFRYERPQAGRQRQLWQVGIEAVGSDDPALDAEVIAVGCAALAAAGVHTTLLLTSLGDEACRPAYRERLRDFLRGLGDQLPAEARARAELNPLRVLDMKEPVVQRLTAGAPLLRDMLCPACKAHIEAVRALLRAAGIRWQEAPRLVRGLDYYVKTTFEWQARELHSAQNAVGGGGRYDGLAELLGGPAAPGVGWSLGLDRTVLALHRQGEHPAGATGLDAYVVPVGEEERLPAFQLLQRLRGQGLVADMPYGGRSLRGHMKAAARSGARVAVLVGERELATGQVLLRDMAASSEQLVALEQVPEAVLARVRPPAGAGS